MASSRSSSTDSEGGGVRLDAGSDSVEATATTQTTAQTTKNERKMSNSAIVPYAGSGINGAGSFNEIRMLCAKAQTLVMKMQQATNSQVGLPGQVRDDWFQKLKDVAQLFVQAQVISTKLEQTSTTEKAQLQGALSAAISERDLAVSQTEAAQQEIQMLRSRLDELFRTGGPHAMTQGNAEQNEGHQQNGPAVKCASWLRGQVGGQSSHGGQSGQGGHDGPKHSTQLHDRYTTDSFGSPMKHRATDHRRPAREPSRVFRGPPPVFGRGGSIIASDIGGPSGPSYPVSDSQIHPGSNLPREMAMLRMNSMNVEIPDPGPDGFLPPITPLAHRTYPRLDEHNHNGYFGPPPPQAAPMAPMPPPMMAGNRFTSDSGYGQRNFVPSFGGLAGLPGPTAQHRDMGYDPRATVANTVWSSLDLVASGAVGAGPSYRQSSFGGEHGKTKYFRESRVMPGLVAVAGKTKLGPGDAIWNEEIFRVFTMAVGFVHLNCNLVDHHVTASLVLHAPRLWTYICSVTYPDNKNNATNHALYLLNNPQYRTYFITRLLIQYIVQQMWDIKAWECLSEDVAETLGFIKRQLTRSHGYDAILTPEQRNTLVDQRARTIKAFVGGQSWPKTRTEMLVKHLNRFKDMVAPFINPTVSRAEATNELSTLCERALRVSGMINMSPLSFQFIFNECGIKFSEQSHHSLNCDLTPMELQARHWRLMCVVTPGITYRDDTQGHVDPHFISKANVLVMQ